MADWRHEVVQADVVRDTVHPDGEERFKMIFNKPRVIFYSSAT